MSLVYHWLIPGLWLAWCACWFIAARFAKPNARQEGVRSRLLHQTPLLVGVVLLSAPHIRFAGLDIRFLPAGVAWFWIGAWLVLAGLACAIWARLYLGSNWSSTV